MLDGFVSSLARFRTKCGRKGERRECQGSTRGVETGSRQEVAPQGASGRQEPQATARRRRARVGGGGRPRDCAAATHLSRWHSRSPCSSSPRRGFLGMQTPTFRVRKGWRSARGHQTLRQAQKRSRSPAAPAPAISGMRGFQANNLHNAVCKESPERTMLTQY